MQELWKSKHKHKHLHTYINTYLLPIYKTSRIFTAGYISSLDDR